MGNADDFIAEIDKYKDGDYKLIFDFSQVHFIDSTGIGILIKFLRIMKTWTMQLPMYRKIYRRYSISSTWRRSWVKAGSSAPMRKPGSCWPGKRS